MNHVGHTLLRYVSLSTLRVGATSKDDFPDQTEGRWIYARAKRRSCIAFDVSSQIDNT